MVEERHTKPGNCKSRGLETKHVALCRVSPAEKGVVPTPGVSNFGRTIGFINRKQ